MRRILIFFIFIFGLSLFGCGVRSPDVPVDLSGWMSIRFSGYQGVGGFFSIKSEKEAFHFYLLDELKTPRGTVRVFGDEVELEDAPIEESFSELFKYWSFVFGSGEIRPPFTRDELIISHTDHIEIGGYYFPQNVEIITVNEFIRINIKYGNSGAGKD